MTNRRVLIVGLALLTAGVIGMTAQVPAGGGWGMPMGPMMGWLPGGTDTQPSPPVSGAPTVEVQATEFAFEPDQLEVETDQTINITLINDGNLTHDLTIPELDLRLIARPGETTSTAITPASPGEYQWLCTIPGHADAGMVGLLIVGGP